MKKLGLILGVLIFTMSSFTDSSKLDETLNCYGLCDSQASYFAGLYGWNAQQEFDYFGECYDAYCRDDNGIFLFPSGNEH